MKALPLVVVAAVLACEAPMREQYVLSDRDAMPEGVAFDAGAGTFFATSVRGGEITRFSPLGQESVFHRAADPAVSFMGAHVDETRGLLWVCEVALAAGPTSRVVALRLGDGRPVRAVELGEAYCEDVVTDAEGAVYATDSLQPRIFRVGAAGATVFAEDPRFAPTEGSLGLTGLDVSPDGENLLVAKLAPPTLFRVRLADPADVAAVQFTGDPFGMRGDPRFPGPDGVAFVGDALYVAYDGGVQQLRFAGDDFKRAEVRTTTAVPPGLTSLVDAAGRLYAIDGDAYRVLHARKQADPPFAIVHVDAGLFDGP